jgi:hypothetical protein
MSRRIAPRTSGFAFAAAALVLAACSDPIGPTDPESSTLPAPSTSPSPSTAPARADSGRLALASVRLASSSYVETTWRYIGQDPFNFYSSNGKARAYGAVNWYQGTGFYDYRFRGDYTSGTKVYAVQAVGCLWAKVTFGYATGSLTVGAGAGGTITGGTKEGAYYVSCRTSPSTLPAPLQLGGVDYAHSFLTWTTLEICTSTYKSQGALHCAWQKRYS